MKKVKIIIILLIGVFGCSEKKTENFEKKIAKKIAKHIIEKDSLNVKRYSGKVFLHIKSEKLNETHFKTQVSLNGFKSKLSEFRVEKLNIKGFETIIYYSLPVNKLNIPEPFFFVPDAESWSFLSEIISNEIFLNELEFVIPKNENKIEELEETDF